MQRRVQVALAGRISVAAPTRRRILARVCMLSLHVHRELYLPEYCLDIALSKSIVLNIICFQTRQ